MVYLLPEPAPPATPADIEAAAQASRRARALEALDRAHGPAAPALAAPADQGDLGQTRAAPIDTSVLYAPLSDAVSSSRVVGRVRGEHSRENVSAYVCGLLVGEQGRRGNEEEQKVARINDAKLKGKAVHLDDPRVLLRAKRAAKRQRAKQQRGTRIALSRSKRKALQADALPASADLAMAHWNQPASVSLSNASFLGSVREQDASDQHRNWQTHAEAVLAAMSRDDVSQLAHALKRGVRGSPLELHGARLRVSHSCCASYVNLSGMLVSESARTVQLLSFVDGADGQRHGRTRTIPTRGSVFALELTDSLERLLAARGHAGPLEINSFSGA